VKSETSFSFGGLFDDLQGFPTRKRSLSSVFAIVFQMDSNFLKLHIIGRSKYRIINADRTIMLGESINSPEESTITYFQQLVGSYPLVLALIAVILLIIVVLIIFLTLQVGNRVNQDDIAVKLKQINVASNGILVDVDALIKNVGETTVILSGIYLHLIELNQTHVIEVEEVFGADLPYEIGVHKELDIYMNFVTDRPLMEDLETEGWIVCHAEAREFSSNKIECTL